MGFWNKAGRWLASAVGLLFVLIGFNALWHGLDIIQVERGWTGVIAGTIAMSTGVVMILLTLLIDRVDALRLAMLTQRALQVAEGMAVPVPMDIAPAEPEADPEPPKPIEVPVEPPPMTPAAAAPAAFSFRTFGKRPKPVLERPLEPEIEAPALEPVPEPVPEQPPEQIRRFAPPQFRRPSVVPPPPAADVEPVTAPEPALEPESVSSPEPEPVVPPHLPEEPVAPVEIVVTETHVSVEASITEAIAEELRLPRVSNLPPMAVEPEQPPMPPAHEEAVEPRGAAQTHAWLEKALAGEESEPGLDWLRQRRTGEERPARNMPSFMRRHVDGEETETTTVEVPEAVAAEHSAPVEPAVEPSPAQEQDRAAVVGRYSANGSDYTLYADGSIDAKTPEGPRHFSSMDELRGFLQRQNETTEG